MGCGSVRSCSEQIQQTVEPQGKKTGGKQAWGSAHQACSSTAGPPLVQHGTPASFDFGGAEGVLPGAPTSPPPSGHQHGYAPHPNALSTTTPPESNQSNTGHGHNPGYQGQQHQQHPPLTSMLHSELSPASLGSEAAPMSLAERTANYEMRLAARRNREQKKKSKKFNKAFLSNVPEVEADIALHFNFWVAGPAAEAAIEAACRSPAAKAMQQGRQDQSVDERAAFMPTISSRSNSPMPHLGSEASAQEASTAEATIATTATAPARGAATAAPSHESEDGSAAVPTLSKTLPAGIGGPPQSGVGESVGNTSQGEEDHLSGQGTSSSSTAPRPGLNRQNSGPRAANACKTMPSMPSSPSASGSTASPVSPQTLSLTSPKRRSLTRRPEHRPGANRCLVQIEPEGAAAGSSDSRKVAKLSFSMLGFDEEAPARLNRLEALSSVIVFAFFVDGPLDDMWGTLEDQLEYMETSVRRLKAGTKAALRPARALLLCHRNCLGQAEEVEDWATALAEFEKLNGSFWKFGPVCPEMPGGQHDDAVYAVFSELAASRATRLSAQAAEESESEESEEEAQHFRSASSLEDSHRQGLGDSSKARPGALNRMGSASSEPSDSKGRRLSQDSDQSPQRDSFATSECSESWTVPHYETERSAVESIVGMPDQMYPTGSTGSYSSRRLSPQLNGPFSTPLTPSGSNTLGLPGLRAPMASEGTDDADPRIRRRPDPGVSYSSYSSSAMGDAAYGSHFTGTSASADFLPEQSMRSADSIASTAPDRSLVESRANVFSTEQSGSSVSSSAYELHIRTFGGAARPTGAGAPFPTNHPPA